MALAFAQAGKPAIDACSASGLTPARMEKCPDWKRAPSVFLGGVNGGPAQRTEVRILWNDHWLFFNFECTDQNIVSPGREDGLDHFRLGDTAEVFIARRGAKNYVEVHATPAGHKTAYFFGDCREPADPPGGADEIRVAAAKSRHGWRAFLAVPRDLFGHAGESDTCEIFFGRYDYAAGDGKPVLSSYPAQRGDKPDFHRREDYAILRLKP